MPFQAANTAAGLLTLSLGGDDLVMPAPWVRVVSLYEFWFAGPHRRELEILPHVDGRAATHTYQDAAQIPMKLIVTGTVLHDGTAPASVLRGLRENVRHLQQFATPSGNGVPVALTALLEMDGEADLAGSLQLEIVSQSMQRSHAMIGCVAHVAAGALAEVEEP